MAPVMVSAAMPWRDPGWLKRRRQSLFWRKREPMSDDSPEAEFITAADAEKGREELAGFSAAAYRGVGIAWPDAGRGAELMAASDISGADGHGVFRLPQYIRRIKAGGLNTAPDIRVIRQARATALVDGDNGLGSLAVARAVEEAIVLARDNGVGWAAVPPGNHAGAAAARSPLPLPPDTLGLYFAVGNGNHLP